MPDLVNPDVRHERGDVNVRAIVGWGFALVAVVAVVFLALWWQFRVLLHREKEAKKSDFPLAAEVRAREGAPLPPQPRLEGFPLDRPTHTVGRQRLPAGLVQAAEEEARLRQFEWIDRKAGIVRLPIEDAVKLALTQKDKYLPARPTGSARDKEERK